MKRYSTLLICLLQAMLLLSQVSSTIYVDKKGVMRWSKTNKEASFYGVNYTLPFAHAYRVMGYLGVDRKKAIDRDVYHFARLGFNAYRIHVWDVEITDSVGNLLSNEHLELLDYLIARLKERNISSVITLQTNFGNGYPERDFPTGAYSFNYPKCSVHSDAKAVEAQQRYVAAFMKHVNPYTGTSYKDESSVVGFEINNEPCHSGSKEEVLTYINGMVDALKKAGNKKPVFYNVSHNGFAVESYFLSDIQGTTYQWYPTGLVAGHMRKGNFLPHVDAYNISFSNVKGFDTKSRLVYEFDPADVMYSYLYPAVTRTFRTAGFQWITQFAYDPIDMAFANTEYQTHFLNLAYTPAKAISMMIAAEVAYNVDRNQTFGTYPADTLFSHFRVSYNDDLSEMNSADKFYYSGTTATQPLSPEKLKHVAGYGSSPIVKYEGKGAYFIDQLEKGVWRLEVMPDALQVSDPFAKASLKKEVVTIIRNAWDMQIQLADLGSEYSVTGINSGNDYRTSAQNGVIASLTPGVYLLSQKGKSIVGKWQPQMAYGNIKLGEYVAPETRVGEKVFVNHKPLQTVEAGKELVVSGEIIMKEIPDSVILYDGQAMFGRASARSIKMKQVGGYMYEAVIPASKIKKGVFRYNIIVCRGNQQQTFPEGVSGTPRDWDYTSITSYQTKVVDSDSFVQLFEVGGDQNLVSTYSLPDKGYVQYTVVDNSQTQKPYIQFKPTSKGKETLIQIPVKDKIAGREQRVGECTVLCIRRVDNAISSQELMAGFITSDGYTYTALCPVASTDGICRIPLKDMKQTRTALVPFAYPSFLSTSFLPEAEIPFQAGKIETLELSYSNGQDTAIEIGNMWLE